eukprot:TRINITY_DN2259_c2_g1_i1.p1 TRINITY_DN2259_c2_g1~~TRINITY_DN2259_c2_g1_i1.p1  ORF type:complete len:408 (+),score=101.82 TRINITY_DN2259_c2_g1_i1:51-1226(+)
MDSPAVVDEADDGKAVGVQLDNTGATVQALCTEGNRHYQEGRYWEAVDAYSRALALRPDDANLLSNRSAAYLNLRKGDLAMIDARRCVEMRPAWAKGYVKAALALRFLGQHSEATAVLERAAEIDPLDPHIRVLQRSSVTDDMISHTRSAQLSFEPTQSQSPQRSDAWGAQPPQQQQQPQQQRGVAQSQPATPPHPQRSARGGAPASLPAPSAVLPQSLPPSVPVVDVVRRGQFSAARRLAAPGLSAEENVALYGKDHSVHGHNFTLEVVVRGPVDPSTGLVLSTAVLDRYLSLAVTEQLDHRSIDTDVAYFRDGGVVPTTENIAAFIWDELRRRMSPVHRPLLTELRLWCTPAEVVVYRGEHRRLDPPSYAAAEWEPVPPAMPALTVSAD